MHPWNISCPTVMMVKCTTALAKADTNHTEILCRRLMVVGLELSILLASC